MVFRCHWCGCNTLIYLLFILLSGLSAWEEVQQLVQRGSWKREDYRYPEWNTKHDSIWKNFDSHHLCFGLFVLVIFFIMASKSYVSLTDLTGLSLADMQPVRIAIDIIFNWLVFFRIRNIFMHIVFKRKPLWAYLYKL